jgi:hypothetical protein
MPNRYFLATLSMMVLIAGTSISSRFTTPDSSASPSAQVDPSALPGEATQRQSLDEQISRRRTFREFLDRLCAALAREETSLREATERLFYYALCCYPEYLEVVWATESGRDIKMKLARNLVRGFRAVIGPAQGVAACAIAARLECDLHALPYEEDARNDGPGSAPVAH